MYKTKYIVFKRNCLEWAVIFPACWDHNSTAAQLLIEDVVVSAGFVTTDADGKLCAVGESVTLGVKSRRTDTALIREQLTSW